ncbi:MAG: hypothetical protein OEN20_12120, partial [Gammaproteobacteria bacterium]|nr:hypothetical protein [Gammaproteobacteria bacterium]
MSATKPPSPQDIPVLYDVVVPGQRAARGQPRYTGRRASDVLELEPEPDEVDDSAIYESLVGANLETLDIEGVIDRVLDKHAEMLR